MQDAFIAIVSEDQSWFDNQITYAAPPRYETKAEALQEIVNSIAKEAAEHPAMADHFELDLKKARLALLRTKRRDTTT